MDGLDFVGFIWTEDIFLPEELTFSFMGVFWYSYWGSLRDFGIPTVY